MTEHPPLLRHEPSKQPVHQGYWPPQGYRTPPPPGIYPQQLSAGWHYEHGPPSAYAQQAHQRPRARPPGTHRPWIHPAVIFLGVITLTLVGRLLLSMVKKPGT